MKNIEPPRGTYLSSDLYLTAFLISSGLELLETKRTSPNRVTFILRDSPQRDKLIHEFYSHKAQVDPLQFKDSIVNLKALIHGLRAMGAA